MEGGHGFNALEHLRDVAYYLADNFGVSNTYCAECGELIEDGGEAPEHEGFHAACDPGPNTVSEVQSSNDEGSAWDATRSDAHDPL